LNNFLQQSAAFSELERGVHAALETYSNVHRGSGHNSMVTTHLFEQARDIVLEHMGLSKGRYEVIFCTPARATALEAQLRPGSFQGISSRDIGLPLGVKALAVERKALPKGPPPQAGGGTTSLVSYNWVIWAKAPDKFEAGTPAIVNIIAFAKALRMIRQTGESIFRVQDADKLSATEILYHDELEDFSGQLMLNELRQTMIGCNFHVPTTEGSRPYINLDNGASTPTFYPVWNAVCKTWRQPGQVRQEIIHEVRAICSGILGAPLSAYDLIFTSNTTEAINVAAESLSRESEQGIEPVVLNTLLEHNSNDLPWRMFPGFSLIRLPVDPEGFLDLKRLDLLMREYNLEGVHGKKRIRLVAVSGASNVLGVFNDLEEISRIVHSHGARLLVDAAQMVAHRKVGVESCGIDYLAFSAHKAYAPFGTGMLIVRKGLLNFSTSELEFIKLSGEENVVGITALGKALVLLQRIGLDLVRKEEQALTGLALRGLAEVPGLKIFGVKDPSSPSFDRKGGVIVFSLKGMMPDRIARELAVRGGIGIRFGCHCSHLLIKHLLNVSPMLERFQRLIATLFPKTRFPGLARISLGIQNTEEDVDILISVLDKIVRKSRASSNKHAVSADRGTPLLPLSHVQKQMKEFAVAASLKVYNPL
jgi:selenocysteine lyase/cysteine desulfurase